MTEAKCKEPMLKYESRCRLVVALLVGAVLLCFSPSTLATAAQSRSLDEVLATLGKGPTLGPASAPVTIIEFSDFQCGYCKKFWADTLPELKKSYFDKGTARFVFRHFAILGKHSEQAALAAECAAEQGQFWNYHDMVFANQQGEGRGYGRESHSFDEDMRSGRGRSCKVGLTPCPSLALPSRARLAIRSS